MYITQSLGRGAIFPTSIRIVWSGGRVSKLPIAILAAASARSFSLMMVCPLIVCRVVRYPMDSMVSRSSVMLSSRSIWW